MSETRHICVPDYQNGVCFGCGEPAGYVRRCPVCEGPVEWYFTCHTYPQSRGEGAEQWMSCMPCDSATLYYCIGHTEECPPDYDCWGYDDHEGCGWRWTNGLNPGNPRAEENEVHNPHWEDQ